MNRKLPKPILNHIKLMEDHLVKLYGTTELSPARLMHYQLGVLNWGPSNFGHYKLPAMYFVQEDWKRAREVDYYTMITISFSSELGKQRFPSSLLLQFVDEEGHKKHCQNNPWPPKINEAHPWLNPIVFGYILRYPFDSDKEQMRRGLAVYSAFWADFYQQLLAESKQLKEPTILRLFTAYAEFMLHKLFTGDLTGILADIETYLPALHWWVQQGGRKKGSEYFYGPPWLTVPLLQTWLEARERGQIERETAAMKIDQYIDEWVIYDLKNNHLRGFPFETILLMVMRIDLGVELETCREFARYFYPYLTAFPFIEKKLTALEVEYEPPSGLIPPLIAGDQFLEMQKKYDQKPRPAPPD